MAITQYDILQTRNKYSTIIAFDNDNNSVLIPVNDKFVRSGTNDFIPDGSATGQDAFAITSPTADIKLSRFNISSTNIVLEWAGTSDKLICGSSVTLNGDLKYGNDGEPPIGDLPAGFTGICKVAPTTSSNGFVFLEFVSGT